MTLRTGAALGLGLFVAVSVAWVVVDEATGGEAQAPGVASPAGDRLVAYYFHGHRRCATCNTIEAWAREAIEGAFPGELRSGRIAWQTLNYEEPANASLRERYLLYTSTLVLSDVRGGAERDWLELDEVWQLAGDKAAFTEYVQRETLAMLEAGP